MNDSQITEFDMGQRVRAHAAGHPADFPAGSRAAAVLATLDATITLLEELAAKQIAANLERQQSTEQKQVAINALVGLMKAVNLTARSINEQIPGIADQFKLGRGGDQATINRGRAFINNASPITTEFTTRDMPATFLGDMKAAIDSFDEAEDRQSLASIALSNATAGLKVAFKTMRAAVRELDAIFRNKHRTDPAALAAWKTASRVEKAPRKSATKKSAPPQSAAPKPSTE